MNRRRLLCTYCSRLVEEEEAGAEEERFLVGIVSLRSELKKSTEFSQPVM